MSLGAFIVVLTLAAAALALWTVVRFPRLGPETLAGAMAQVAVALVSGWLLVPVGMKSALALPPPGGALLAVFLFALPSLVYLFLAALWAMRVLQQLLHGVRH